jgi:hypothetical protein
VHPNTLLHPHNLALTYSNQGRRDEAEKLGFEVMETSVRVLGAEHPNTLTSMDNLAHTWKALGRNEDALDLIASTHALFEKKLGQNHPNTQTVKHTLDVWRSA